MAANPDAVIERHDLSEQGWFGRIWARGLELYTGELPWVGNQANVSAIPPGPERSPIVRQVVWSYSPRFLRNMYLLLATEPRTGCRVHAANLMGAVGAGFRAQLNGCVALGERLGWIDGQKALLLSVPAIRRFEAHMGTASFLLEIRNA